MGKRRRGQWREDERGRDAGAVCLVAYAGQTLPRGAAGVTLINMTRSVFVILNVWAC